jgi:hypothetical protein
MQMALGNVALKWKFHILLMNQVREISDNKIHIVQGAGYQEFLKSIVELCHSWSRRLHHSTLAIRLGAQIVQKVKEGKER